MLTSVIGKFALWCGETATALIKGNNKILLGIKVTTMIFVAARTRAAVKKHYWNSGGVSACFDMK